VIESCENFDVELGDRMGNIRTVKVNDGFDLSFILFLTRYTNYWVLTVILSMKKKINGTREND